MKINKQRIKNNLTAIGEIGKNKNGGITRLAFSSDYYKAVDSLKNLMEKANLQINQDNIGNVFGKRSGKYDSFPSIMLGSHLDTVKNGGLFDGTLGVIAGLECLNILNEQNISTNHPIELAAFNAEEGSEMGGTFGSRVMIGLQDPSEKALQSRLKNYDLTSADLKNSIRDIDKIKAFLELHVEQGVVLDRNEIPIGIVNGIAGITRYKIIVKGETNHAGTTPMNLRKDALTAAANLITKIEKIATSFTEPFVATVGKINVSPGAVNVIPGKVEMVLEMRDLEQDKIDLAIEKFKTEAKKIENAKIVFNKMIQKPPVETDNKIQNIIEKACNDNNISYKFMASGAGHDAKEIARKIPSGMIFVPSKDGKSHCPEEWTNWDDIYRGVEVLLNTILLLDHKMSESI